MNIRKSLAVCVYVNTVVAVALSLYLFLIPAGELIWDLRDPGLGGESIPRFAFRWHRALSPKYEKWARDRVRSGKAAQLSTADIAGTEWPLFGSVFYLWATEALQEAVWRATPLWELDFSPSAHSFPLAFLDRPGDNTICQDRTGKPGFATKDR